MADHITYEQGKKNVVRGLILLAVVTLIEVFFSLLGKGHIVNIDGMEWIVILTAIIIVVLSLYKAYFIIYEFMHLRYEMKGLALTVLLPTTLLVWAIIAFFQEGDSWKNRRELIQDKNELPTDVEATPALEGDEVHLNEVEGAHGTTDGH